MRKLSVAAAIVLACALAVAAATSAGTAGDARVSAGSPASPFSQNKQNEPAVAIDPANPNVVVAGANDNIDMEACNAGDPTTCPFTDGVGVSGVYFSLDGGATWTQPEYTGLTARDCLGPDPCEPHEGPIGTLPGYVENGLVSDGDPAVAFGPRPDSSGAFSWENGSRLYYANLTSNLPPQGGAQEEDVNGREAGEEAGAGGGPGAVFRGPEAIAVSRTDDVQAAAAGDNGAWMDPVIVSKQSSTTFSDKEQIWADNAASSPYFGNVYVCIASFRSNSQGNALPQPLVVGTSTDGGDTWRVKQVTPAVNNPFNPRHGFGRSGCTVRTDSDGVVYVLANQFAVGLPGNGAHILIRSFDGGKTWTRPNTIFQATDTCFSVQFDGAGFRCVMDGVAGARDDLSSSPSIDIANGAPSGAGASDVIYDTWVDGRDGVAHPHVMLSWSTDKGDTWADPIEIERPGDRGYYSAVALSPDGTDAYVVYNAFTTPFRDDTTSPRGLVGVVLHADVSPDGSPGPFTEIHRGAVGDPRASSQNNLVLEFLGDYVYADATNDAGVGVWNDVRDGADCPAIDAWRASVQAGTPTDRPEPQQDCPATFGNTDIYGGSFADPTP